MGLPYDVARCIETQQNWDCPLARYCLRRKDKGRAEYQPFTAFKGGAGCDGFIDEESPRRLSRGPVERRADTGR